MERTIVLAGDQLELTIRISAFERIDPLAWLSDDEQLAKQIKYCQEELTRYRALYTQCMPPSKVSYITACKGHDIVQHRKFRIRPVCNSNILVYNFERHWLEKNRARGALITEMHKANPGLLLENRNHFLGCEHGKEPRDATDFEDFVQDHLTLCNWVEAKLVACGLNEQDMILPTMRAVTMLFWPGPKDSNETGGRAAIVLTGDYSQMRSGPITLDTLREHELPGFFNSENVAYVPLERAAQFLAQVDQNEVAINEVLRNRNEICASATKKVIVSKAEATIGRKLSQSSALGDTPQTFTEYFASSLQTERRERISAEKLRDLMADSNLGYSEWQASLIAGIAMW